MLHNAMACLVVALVSGALGFGGIAGSGVGIAKLVCVVFAITFIALLLAGRTRKPSNARLVAWRPTRTDKERYP